MLFARWVHITPLLGQVSAGPLYRYTVRLLHRYTVKSSRTYLILFRLLKNKHSPKKKPGKRLFFGGRCIDLPLEFDAIKTDFVCDKIKGKGAVGRMLPEIVFVALAAGSV